MRTTVLAVIVGLMCTFAAPALAQCPSDADVRASLAAAEELYVVGTYEDIPPMLETLLVDSCINSEERRLDAYLILGTAEFQLGELAVAELTFLDMLRLNPAFSVDDSVISVPAPVRKYVEIVRDRNKDELDEIRKDRLIEAGAVVETVWVTVEENRNQYWLNFMPFGAGQFQNGDMAWGGVFAGTQAAALGLAFTGAIMVEVVRARDGQFTFAGDDVNDARAWQVVQVSGMIGFSAFFVAGVIHALVNYEDIERTVLPPSRDRPKGLGEDDGVSWYLNPSVGSDGGALNVTIEF